MTLYMILPSLGIFFTSRLYRKQTASKPHNIINLLPHIDRNERLNFLETYFTGSKDIKYISDYLRISHGISIIRDYSAGSNARTMLCSENKNNRSLLFFRKYAFGHDAEKLYSQIKWIDDNKNFLPLPEILKCERTQQYCYYDMPYNDGAAVFFEYMHSVPVSRSWDILRSVIECLNSSIYTINNCKADEKSIHDYIESKVIKNLAVIKSSGRLQSFLKHRQICINGVNINNLQYYGRYLTHDYLYKIFKNDNYSVIHGDLTVENIICFRDRGRFYLIDPNTGNIHNSPALDYGKLLQSLHGGYEFLMRMHDAEILENNINFLFTISSVYKELHEKFRDYMLQNLGQDLTRSIYFHEIVHWLRLMTYKINRDERTAALFYAGMLTVISDVIKMYGDD